MDAEQEEGVPFIHSRWVRTQKKGVHNDWGISAKRIFCHYRVRVHSYLLVFLQARVSDALRSAISRVVVSVTLQV